jgi:hypothetical protein
MSGLAIFGLKYNSLLQFDKQRNTDVLKHNLRTLYQVEQAPADTTLRERLDEVDPQTMRGAFKSVYTAFQRGKGLEPFAFLDGKYLILMDGTEYYCSKNIKCESCCSKKHTNGSISYHHQVLGTVIAHPNMKQVIPLCPEPILKQDGQVKNDCEVNAAKRWLESFRRDYPQLNAIVVHDAIVANGPYIRCLKENETSFIIGVTEEGNKTLFSWIEGIKLEEVDICVDERTNLKIRFVNNIPINDAHSDVLVNFLECVETKKKWDKQSGKEIEQVTKFTWITDINITKNNAYKLTQGGRCRWKIENETFNTLKNQGYKLEHNFGHGNKHLTTVMMLLMFLAFTIDQIQESACRLFQAAKDKMGSRKSLWEMLRALFLGYFIESWMDIWLAIANGHRVSALTPNTT